MTNPLEWVIEELFRICKKSRKWSFWQKRGALKRWKSTLISTGIIYQERISLPHHLTWRSTVCPWDPGFENLWKALLSSMWYCGSICAAFMWRYMIPSLTPPSGRFMTCQKYTQKRLILLTYFWAIEAFLGILALRSLNYVNEEARDKVTPKSALIKMQVFSLLRNAFKNKPPESSLGPKGT